jgi:hypothetical protein
MLSGLEREAVVRCLRLITGVVFALVLVTDVASAKQDDGLIEHLSGPGPFLRFPSLDIRVACITRVGNDNYTVGIEPWARGSTSEFAFKKYVPPPTPTPQQTAKLQCSRDENVRGYVVVAWGHLTGLDNNLFPDNNDDKDNPFKVKAEVLSARFMGRTLNDVVDVGFGLDVFMFYGKTFNNFTRFAIEPFRVSVAPFAALNSSQRSRAFRLAIAPKIMLGGVDQDDFCNTEACNVVPRQFSAKYETVWATTVELDILALFRKD